MEKVIRKYQDHLIICGNALVAFGVWGLLRIFVLKASDKTIFEAMAETLGREYGIDAAIVDMFFIFIYIIIEFAFRIYIRRSALRESRGNKVSAVYLVVSAFYILTSVIFYILYLTGKIVENTDINAFSIVIIDITTVIALMIIIVTSVKLRKLRADQEGAGEENAD